MNINWLLVLIAVCHCNLTIFLEGQPQDSDTLITKGYEYEAKTQKSTRTVYTNDPGYSFKEERCPMDEGTRLGNGYLFEKGGEKCEGYIETYLQDFKKTQQENPEPYENFTFPEKFNDLKEFLKVRKSDQFSISFTVDGQLHSASCNFAHPRKLPKQLVEHIKGIKFEVKKPTFIQIFSLSQGQFKQIDKIQQTVKGKFNRSLISKGKGLHQNLTYLITPPKNVDIHQQCHLIISDYLTESFYLDADQFNNLERTQVIDVQKPAFLSKQYWYRLTYPLSQLATTKSSYVLTHPIHLRYQQSSKTHEYIPVTIQKANSVVISCPDNKTYEFEETYNPATLSSKVPVGQKTSLRTVNFLTLLVTICGALIINKELRRRQLVA